MNRPTSLSVAEKLLQPVSVEHSFIEGRWTSSIGSFRYTHGEQVESAEEAQVPFGEPSEELTVGQFLGMALHLLQQCGGELSVMCVLVEAHESTVADGSAVRPTDILLVGDRAVAVADLMRGPYWQCDDYCEPASGMT